MVIIIWIYRISLCVTTNDVDKCDGRTRRHSMSYAHSYRSRVFRPTSNTIKLTKFNWEAALQERCSYPIIDQINGTAT